MASENEKSEKRYRFRNRSNGQTNDTESSSNEMSVEKKQYTVGFIAVLAAYAAVFAMVFTLRLLDGGHAFDVCGKTTRYILYGILTVCVYVLPGVVYTILRRLAGGNVRVFTTPAPHTASFTVLTGLFALMTGLLYRFFIIRQLAVPLTDTLIIGMEAGDSRYLLLLFGVLPAAAKEYFFRGVLQSELTKIGGGFTGIAASALASALCVSNARLFPEMLLIGLLLSLLAYMSGSFIPSAVVRIVIHTLAVLFGDRLRFIAAERAGNTFTLILLAMLWLIVLVAYLRAGEGVCTNKVHRIEAMMPSDNEDSETSDQKKESEPVSKSKPNTKALLMHLRAPAGYTLHKFMRVILSPSFIVSAVLFIILAFR